MKPTNPKTNRHSVRDKEHDHQSGKYLRVFVSEVSKDKRRCFFCCCYLHSFPRQLAHSKLNSPSNFCAILLLFFTIKQVCHQQVCHLSLCFSQQASVPLSSLPTLFFLLSFKVNALVWQDRVCHLVFFFSHQGGVPPLGVPPIFFFLTPSSCANEEGVPADEGNCVEGSSFCLQKVKDWWLYPILMMIPTPCTLRWPFPYLL